MRLKMLVGCGALVGAAVACSFPQTRMEPVQDYVTASRPSVSGQPAYNAGPSYLLTASHDGSTFIVACDGRMYPQLPSMRQLC